uniref:Uncharacterized protein n=1 Tax=Pyrodinium bahamense TaxID=73915 RepID=A0A7S0AQX5_9DINO
METTTEEAAPTPAPAPICTCPNGTPAAGDKCPKDGGVKCESCKSGFELTNETACKVKSSGGGDGKDGDGDGKTKVVEKLKVAFTVAGIDYNALMADEGAKKKLEEGMKGGIATSLGIPVESILELLFSQGSINVEAVIKPPEGVNTTELSQTISSDPSAMTQAVVSEVETLKEELEAAGVVTGDITVSEPTTVVVQEIVPITPAPIPAPTPAPTPAPKPNPPKKDSTRGGIDDLDDDDGLVGQAPPQASRAALAAFAMLAAVVHVA